MGSTVVDQASLAIDGGEQCVVDRPTSYLHGPQEIGDDEIAAVTDVLKRGNLFRFMKDKADSPTAQFEAAFKAGVGCEHVLAVNSGTSALIAAMIGLGVSSGDEVIVPAYTYIASAAAALAVRAIPVIAEIDNSLTLDPDDVRRKISPRTKVIVPVHMQGVPCRMDEILAVAREHGVAVLEDCAQANGGTYRGRALGSLGDAGAFSFQQYKIITAGEGGAVTTNRREVFQRAACYHDSAYTFWKAEQWQIEPFLGENYRMSELNGALALAQLGKRDRILRRLREIKRRFVDTIADLEGLELRDVPDPEGDCGLSVIFFMPTPELAERFAKMLVAEGMAAGSMFDKGIPDRHVYYHWDYIMQQRTPDVYGYPWRDPRRPCQIKYSRDMCPRSLAYLNRSVSLPLTQVMSDAHVESCLLALRKVHAWL